MAYSNINKDKVQVLRGNLIKTAVFVVGLLIVTFSSLMNIYRQMTVLREAKVRNLKLKTALNRTLTDNKVMLRQIGEASGSAYIDRREREYFGLGTSADYWLILPKDGKDLKLNDEIKVVENRPNILKWWDLFIK
jgi:hypothetical protein